MIYIGASESQKPSIIKDYILGHGIKKCFLIETYNSFICKKHVEHVDFQSIIMYSVFYRLLQEIDDSTLIVVNECLISTNRHDLGFNCIRNFINQTKHVLVFNLTPFIDCEQDFMTLFDFVTNSNWKRRKFNLDFVRDNAVVNVSLREIVFDFERITSARPKNTQYAKKKLSFYNAVKSDPHIIPRRLHLYGQSEKLNYVNARYLMPLFDAKKTKSVFITRGNVSVPHVYSYQQVDEVDFAGKDVYIIEFPHRFIRFIKFMRTSGQCKFKVIVTNYGVDLWYFERYSRWGGSINAFCTNFS